MPLRRTLLASLTALTVLVSGSACAVGGSGAGTAGGDRSITDIIRDAVEEAKKRNQSESGRTSGRQEESGEVLRADTRTQFNYDEYQNMLRQVIALLEQYWSETLPAAYGVEYSSPQRYEYYRSDEGGGPRCGDEEAPARNAFYCPAGDFIAWDESGLMIPYYVQGGDFAAAFVLAHEFGHAMQVRLPQQVKLGVIRELQADCFAGAWSKWVSEQGRLEAGDLDEATLAVFAARDVPGTPFTDPRAHGSGFERTRAFGDGFEIGPRACHPARADDWVVAAR
ncbi:MAG: neutral zinc metallopeptidase [Actinomycetota bacterium]|nr:neutral zinc metallopeptidase [Actinomycetota bacterium]